MSKQELYIKRAYEFYAEMGYTPSQLDYAIIPNTPALTTIKKYFGSWSNYIKTVDFPDDYNTKKTADSVYVGKNWSKGDNYYQHFENQYITTKHIINKYLPDGQVTYNYIHNQLLFVFEWKKKLYTIAFFNTYVHNYQDKIDTLKAVLKDMNIEVINLNKKGRWIEKYVEEVFTRE